LASLRDRFAERGFRDFHVGLRVGEKKLALKPVELGVGVANRRLLWRGKGFANG
jgi:hypothetical protein